MVFHPETNEDIQRTIDGLMEGDQDSIKRAIAVLESGLQPEPEVADELLVYNSHERAYIVLNVEPISPIPEELIELQAAEIMEAVEESLNLSREDVISGLEGLELIVYVFGNFPRRKLDSATLIERTLYSPAIVASKITAEIVDAMGEITLSTPITKEHLDHLERIVSIVFNSTGQYFDEEAINRAIRSIESYVNAVKATKHQTEIGRSRGRKAQ